MEGDAGAVPLSTDEDQQTAETSAEGAADAGVDTEQDALVESNDPAAVDAVSAPSRLGRRQQAGICVLLLLLAAGLVAAGMVGLREHAASQQLALDNAEALEAAKACVLATQVPDPDDVSLSQQKMLNCAAGEFRTQATLFAQILPPAYQAAKVHVELTEMGAAVERNNPDGSIDVLVAFRVKADNIEAKGKEVGYRLRAQMIREDGQYRIGKLDQVAK
ncbi:Mce protein [Mycolicibacter minnesotensis]|uniref:Mce protein n=1 Tax=Mycolicibacter minnesotensis TaxID=1118379 RepID=A0A7I7R6U9_9MYCO|nr:Mce protein [Mycolicibacter minnesotensis]ORA97966.1 Mce protein [Mycolicibacter minnesotensis]BBY33810.1 membrane protein [Mycolicibacter minnesotensis]